MSEVQIEGSTDIGVRPGYWQILCKRWFRFFQLKAGLVLRLSLESQEGNRGPDFCSSKYGVAYKIIAKRSNSDTYKSPESKLC